jgi:hypothetical protein
MASDSTFKQPHPSLRANGSRECAPDDRLREAIQLWRSETESWIASSQGLLAMTARHLAACFLREVFLYFPPSRNRGRRECRAPDAPDSRVCNGSSKNAHALVRSHRNHPAFPTQWFTVYCVLSPVLRAFWPPSPARLHADLTPASGCQNHTPSPSADERSRQ